MEEEKLFGTSEVAKMLSINVSTVHNYIVRGILVPDAVVPSATGTMVYRKFKQSTIDEFARSCGVDVSNGEDLLSTGEVATILGVGNGAVKHYVDTGTLKPDVVLPPRRNGSASRQKFKRSTVVAFIERCREIRKEEGVK